MKMRNVFILVIVIVSLPILEQPNFAQEPVRFVTDPPQRLDVPFRLFRTENIWTQLLLDTRNGRIWQVCYSVDPNAVDRKFPINDTPLVALVDDEKEVGRFTLYPTGNMWTFLLLDQKTGNVWHCQFSMKDSREYNFIQPIPPFEHVVFTPAPQPATNLSDIPTDELLKMRNMQQSNTQPSKLTPEQEARLNELESKSGTQNNLQDANKPPITATNPPKLPEGFVLDSNQPNKP